VGKQRSPHELICAADSCGAAITYPFHSEYPLPVAGAAVCEHCAYGWSISCGDLDARGGLYLIFLFFQKKIAHRCLVHRPGEKKRIFLCEKKKPDEENGVNILPSVAPQSHAAKVTLTQPTILGKES
jgi:hypothetical protein